MAGTKKAQFLTAGGNSFCRKNPMRRISFFIPLFHKVKNRRLGLHNFGYPFVQQGNMEKYSAIK
jgi:hypothetical protein